MAAEARIIDLEAYRRRRGQQSSSVSSAPNYGSAMFATMAWYPVMIWVPVWPCY
jgi:hypothetical protein